MSAHVIPAAPESKTFSTLREAWPVFVYDGYDLTPAGQSVRVTFRFEITGLVKFRPTLDLVLPSGHTELDETARRIIFNIGMVELISYWKTTCSPVVRVDAGPLSDRQIMFWKTLYYGGLGEFFYRNKIRTNSSEFMTIQAAGISEPTHASAEDNPGIPNGMDERSHGPTCMLVPVGGGKDSAVTLARLKPQIEEIFGFAVNPTQAALDTMTIAGIPEERRILVRRSLDPNILEMNRLGYWNGHTPFSALLAFITSFEAYVYNLNYIVLSNESSADEATVAGTGVNHQFSKSTAFEQAFQDYARTYLGTKALYFSFMRPFAEIAIAREFARHPEYFPVFRSCNVGSKQNVWCGHCAKCLFVACILSPFIERPVLNHIFGQDLFEDESLSRDLEGLTGKLELKPWECVGTVSEVNVALCSTIGQHLDSGRTAEELPVLLRMYIEWAKDGLVPSVQVTSFGRPICIIDQERDPLTGFNEDHRIPAAFLPYLEGMLSEPY